MYANKKSEHTATYNKAVGCQPKLIYLHSL